MKKAIQVLMMMCVLFVAVPPPPSASVLAVTDVTANKTLLAAYAKMTAIFTKLSAMYTVGKTHLDTAVEVEGMMSDAYDTYDTIVNLDLQEIIEDFKSSDGLYTDNPFGRLTAVQGFVEGKVSLGQDTIDYAVSLKNRVKNIERLAKLKIAAIKNMGKASKDVNDRKSNQITAQSVAILAALAALEEQEKKEKAIAKGNAKKVEKEAILDMSSIYSAMGKKKR